MLEIDTLSLSPFSANVDMFTEILNILNPPTTYATLMKPPYFLFLSAT
uniref:Uncharacterized protein n=1 Tax=Rhizophora mucronata TaxID=61149 RepID=A0A2P2NU12_RHIMU